MNGAPIKTQADANKIKNEYMNNLNLQEQINEMNLTANKNYLLTGQLPPQSQLQDTRTNSEKLKDVELLKQNIASSLSSVMEAQTAYAIVQRIMESPLNLNNSLLRFLSQRGPSIAEQFSKQMAMGVGGDINDIDRIVEFIKNLYTDMQGRFTTTKSYINSISTNTTSSKVVSANDIDSIIMGLEDLVKNFLLINKKIDLNTGNIKQNQLHELGVNGNDILQILYRIVNAITLLKSEIPTTNELTMLLNDTDRMFNNNTAYSVEVFDILEKLPKYTEVMALIGKIKQYITSDNFSIVMDGLYRLDKMFSSLYSPQVRNVLREFKTNVLDVLRRDITLQQQVEATQSRKFIQRQTEAQKDASKASKVYIVNPETDPIWVRNPTGLNTMQTQQQPIMQQATLPPQPPQPPPKQQPKQNMNSFIESTHYIIDLISNANSDEDLRDITGRVLSIPLNPDGDNYSKKFKDSYNILKYYNRGDNIPFKYIKRVLSFVLSELDDDTLKTFQNPPSASGSGLKRRGRPRGSGMPKPVLQKLEEIQELIMQICHQEE